MHADPEAVPVESHPEDAAGEAVTIACAYHRAARGDAWEALVAAITDALADLDAAERRIARQSPLISRGYARGWTGAGGARTGSATAPGSCADALSQPASASAESARG